MDAKCLLLLVYCRLSLPPKIIQYLWRQHERVVDRGWADSANRLPATWRCYK